MSSAQELQEAYQRGLENKRLGADYPQDIREAFAAGKMIANTGRTAAEFRGEYSPYQQQILEKLKSIQEKSSAASIASEPALSPSAIIPKVGADYISQAVRERATMMRPETTAPLPQPSTSVATTPAGYTPRGYDIIKEKIDISGGTLPGKKSGGGSRGGGGSYGTPFPTQPPQFPPITEPPVQPPVIIEPPIPPQPNQFPPISSGLTQAQLASIASGDTRKLFGKIYEYKPIPGLPGVEARYYEKAKGSKIGDILFNKGEEYLKGGAQFVYASSFMPSDINEIIFPSSPIKTETLSGVPARIVLKNIYGEETLKSGELIPGFFTTTGYSIGLINPWIGGGLVTAGKSVEAEQQFERGELSAKERRNIFFTSAAEGILFGAAGGAVDKLASNIGARFTGQAARLASISPSYIQAPIGAAGLAIQKAGVGIRNIIDTYFISELGSQTISVAKEAIAEPNLQGWERGVLQLTGGTAGFIGGKSIGEFTIPKIGEAGGFSKKPLLEYSAENNVVVLREPRALQLERVFTKEQLNILRRGDINLKAEITPRVDAWLKSQGIDTSKSQKGIFFRVYETPYAETIPTFTSATARTWGEMYREQLDASKSKGLSGLKARYDAFLNTPIPGGIIISSEIKNPSFNKLSKVDAQRLKDFAATSNKDLPKDLKKKLWDTIISDKLRESEVWAETPEVEIFLKNTFKINTNARVNVIYDPASKKYIPLLESKTDNPTIIQNVKDYLNLRKNIAKDQTEYIKKNLKILEEYGYKSVSPPGHTMEHMSNVQDNFNNIVKTNQNANKAIEDLISKYPKETQNRIRYYLENKFAFMHDIGKRQSSSVEIKGLEHANVVADVYRYGYAKSFDKDFYKLPKEIQNKIIQAWRAHTDITPGELRNVIYRKNPLAKILSNADRYDITRFGQEVIAKKIFKEYQLDSSSELIASNSYIGSNLETIYGLFGKAGSKIYGESKIPGYGFSGSRYDIKRTIDYNPLKETRYSKVEKDIGRYSKKFDNYRAGAKYDRTQEYIREGDYTAAKYVGQKYYGIPKIQKSKPPYTSTQQNMFEPKIIDYKFPLGRKRKRRGIASSKAYSILIRRRGKYRPVASGLPRGIALAKLQRELTANIARTGKLVETGFTEMPDISFKPSEKIFRTYQMRKGIRKPLVDTFIQRSSANLRSFSEQESLRQARLMKGILA